MSDSWKPERAPKGLSGRSNKFWSTVTAKYDLRPDEYRLLEDSCRTMDVVDALQVSFRGEPLTVVGGRGQVTVHPLLVELRQQRIVLASLLKQLGLPSEEEGESGTVLGFPRSVQARKAAMSRWTVAHGYAG